MNAVRQKKKKKNSDLQGEDNWPRTIYLTNCQKC